MDPSLSISSDPHHPPQFAPFPPFSNPNPFVSGAVNPPIHPYGPGAVNQNPYNNHVFQSQPQTQPSYNHPPYSEMICAAIAALNEPEGSSKRAISRYIERSNPVLPPAHGPLLTFHLKSLKNSGVVSMVKKSYKLFASIPPESIAAAAASAGLEVPRSENLPTNTINDQQSGSASQTQKRGRGRPPKPKPEAHQQQQQQLVVDVESNGQSAAITKPIEGLQESVKRGPGRPRKNGASPIVQASVISGIMKRRGRPPGRRAAGRQRKPKSVSSTASVFPFVANGARRRGRPRRVDTVAPTGGEIVVVAPGMKRGRGRPPKIGGVITRLMKPIRGRGRPVGRPRKLMTGATGTQDSAYGELKKKFDIFQEKTREIVNVLKAGGVTSNNQEVVQQAIEDLERLITMETVEPLHVVEGAQREEAAPEPDTEAQNEGEAQGKEHEQEREGGEVQTQTEAEAMQEALF